MKNQTFILSSLIFFMMACNGNEPQNNTTETTYQEDQAKAPEAPSSSDEGTASAPEPLLDLSKVDISSLILLDTYTNSDAGDCSTEAKKYRLEDKMLVVDESDCGDYGGSKTYYLLSANEEIEQVHERRRSNYVDTKEDGSPAFMVEISENVYDFRQSPPKLMALRDVMENDSSTPRVKKITLDADQAWLIARHKGDDTVFGQKISIGNDYEGPRKMMIDSLVRLGGVPDEIPLRFEGELGMGIRGEYRSMCSEAIDMARKILLEQAKNPFNLTTQKLTETKAEGDFADPMKWKGYYKEMFK